VKKYYITAFILLIFSVASIFAFDRYICVFLCNKEIFLPFFSKISEIGSFEWVFLIVSLIVFLSFWIKPLRQFVFIMCVSIILADTLVIVLKYMLGQARPIMYIKDNIYGFYPFTFRHDFDSMPSGHTTLNSTLAFSIYIKNKKIGTLLIVWAILVGLSRMFLCKHYLSNVLMSYAISIFVVLISYSLEKKLQK